MPGIGAPRAGGEGPGLVSRDPRSELLRGMPDVSGELAIAIAVTDDQEQARPILYDKVLHESVGEHRSARHQMKDVGATILTTQPVLGGSGVEHRGRSGL